MLPPEPSAVLGVVVAGWLYAKGVRTLWSRAGRGHVVKPWQVVCFASGLLALMLALESPIDAISDQLFAVHMVQHLLLILVAGPLLVVGAPLAPILWALPRESRAPVGAFVRRLVPPASVALALHSAALWFWHVPPLYEAAINSRGIHVLEHLCFLVTSAMFWWSVLHRGRKSYALGAVYVLVLSFESMILGALLTFASAPWYASHLQTTAAWGLSPLEDQQLAGLIMWLPGGVIYLVSALALFGAWFREPADTPVPVARTPVHR